MNGLTADTMRAAPGALLIVAIAEIRCAFPVERIAEVLPAAQVTPLPDAPETVAGVVNLRGELVVVLDGHRCVDRETPPLQPTDRFVVLDGDEPRLAVRVDHAHDIQEVPDDAPVSEVSLAADRSRQHTIALLPDGVLVIRDPAAFVTAPDAQAIRTALAQMRQGLP